jgi:hypothetical protein
MAVSKLSQITVASSPLAPTDQLVAVVGGTTDNLVSRNQLAVSPVSSITRNYNGNSALNANDVETVAIGGWEGSGTTMFAQIEFHPPLANNVTTMTYSSLSDFLLFDSASGSFLTVTGIFLGFGGTNGCYLTASFSGGATPGRFAALVAATSTASITFS